MCYNMHQKTLFSNQPTILKFPTKPHILSLQVCSAPFIVLHAACVQRMQTVTTVAGLPAAIRLLCRVLRFATAILYL